ncbi:hypothetical protein DSCW_18890 [Desulfosarcina widdelii]|uniref:Uncharacterized protein n=1 Tax=Desulfosarcina widdelii TaxID=947919 RepID=A0A5K7YXG6_9BACT|nr:hypothetical protein [Desulfosarcina widdelii]BBO74472.1 hypothetical protein DSCW_18890 [Desulfosarcina widdelii]
MGLDYSFRAAKKKIDRLEADERARLLEICKEIRRAEQALSEKAVPLLQACVDRCQGLCCRNIRPADIVTEWDLVYILAMVPQLEPAIAACLSSEDFFPSDCIFLANGVGPCLFPDDLRPERCIISFCRVEPSIEKEIGRVMGGFSRLIRFFKFRPLRRIAKRIVPAICRHRPVNR